MDLNETYLVNVKKQFVYYKTVAEKAIAQLEENQLFVALNDDTNSISVIIKHLNGNMLSRWTDFLTADGEKEWRDRDAEFIDTYTSKAEVMEKWDAGWKCLLNGLDSLAPEQLSTIVYLRNEGHTVIEAINRQLAHYPYHIGQIVFYAKLLKKGNWDSSVHP
ncbi:DUF1572 family protein [Flavobacterium kingsejongi]|uniref:DUF1572 family protein n=1 Tax=Flavobacterium kingsejongi TaxID=1678728 RepID=UPI0026C8DA27|nr:DUF1572 family protein [Flavobacterium kingsejongi]